MFSRLLHAAEKIIWCLCAMAAVSAADDVHALSCTESYKYFNAGTYQSIFSIEGCVQKPGNNPQGVAWKINNLTGDKYEFYVKKVYTTSCGKTETSGPSWSSFEQAENITPLGKAIYGSPITTGEYSNLTAVLNMTIDF